MASSNSNNPYAVARRAASYGYGYGGRGAFRGNDASAHVWRYRKRLIRRRTRRLLNAELRNA